MDYWTTGSGKDATLIWLTPGTSGNFIVHTRRAILDRYTLRSSNATSFWQSSATSIDGVIQERPGLTHAGPLLKHPLQMGQYHPRIWREVDESTLCQDLATGDELALDATATSLRILLSDLASVCEVLEPHPQNAKGFGHRIRHLLLTSCMEVESAWKAILVANGYPKKKPTTRDYVRLKGPLRLEEWSVRLANHKTYPSISPFKGWKAGDESSRSLPWYQAYNATKHDREGGLDQATLEHVVVAVAAVLVMAAAQFGTSQWRGGVGAGPFGQNVFKFIERPRWSISELYMPPEPGEQWSRTPLDLWPASKGGAS